MMLYVKYSRHTNHIMIFSQGHVTVPLTAALSVLTSVSFSFGFFVLKLSMLSLALNFVSKTSKEKETNSTKNDYLLCFDERR